MKRLTYYHVDAFASDLFAGNPAGVMVLDEWLDDTTLQSIAAENNLPETAFLVKAGEGYEIRWFSPALEVDLCGHATLASAHILFLHYETDLTRLQFFSRVSGNLFVEKKDDLLVLDFPADDLKPVDLPGEIFLALGDKPLETYFGRSDYMFVFENQHQIETLDPDFNMLRAFQVRGNIVTAPGDDVDFVSRFFAPAIDINEDPVTGSAHTTLAPFWGNRLGKTIMEARQLSKRGGELRCELIGDRVKIAGRAVVYMEGTLSLPS